jgi:hypothetical protein
VGTAQQERIPASSLSTFEETAIVDEESVEPTSGHPELILGGTRCRLTCEDRTRGFHQGQSNNARKQAVYSDAVRPIHPINIVAEPGKSL